MPSNLRRAGLKAVMAVTVAFLVAACGSSSSSSTGAASSSGGGAQTKRVKIAFLVPELADPYWAAGEKGAKAEAAADNVDLAITGTNTFTPSQYNSALQDEIIAGVNGLLVAPGDPKASNVLINQAVQKKIAVATVVVDTAGSSRSFFIGPNATEIGTDQAKRVLTYLKATGAKGVVQVAIMSCSPSALSQELEYKAEKSVLAANPYSSQFTVKIDTFLNSTSDPTSNLAAYNNLATAYPGLKVVIGQCGLDPVSAGEVNKNRNLHWIVAGDSFLPQTLKYVQSGDVTWTFNEEPYETLQAAIKLMAGGLRGTNAMPTGIKSIPLNVAVKNVGYMQSIHFPGPVVSVPAAEQSPDAAG
ncbi:MAG TPA: substrate-binding domain-containing protein [Solirubrobacteraceae bacterium]|nr:substrate-binding domain-containing protein [Solirubrobacteraceae bacterium]